MLLCDKNNLNLSPQPSGRVSIVPVGRTCRESAVAQFSAQPPAAIRGEEKRPMVLASSREDGAPKASHSYNAGKALARVYTGVSPGGMISRVLPV